ncbi:nuclear transport factor 2 family protein [Haloarchaeobius amylolyticus]|uniref:nuclear transport factor 2 family protein n=1 Tax=Haloarchaeobius amylolyticus TaxID=1198296 RepID=UPI00226F048E|nr:nuclear transport factor 2 family protein [Haloarchaeobius amylolyticus]
MDLAEPVATYYRALDEHEYESLQAVLAPGFVQYRPDRTFEDRASFVRFMREDRPRTDTTHALDAVHEDGTETTVRGRVLADDGEVLVRFVDVFELADGEITALRTYTN